MVMPHPEVPFEGLLVGVEQIVIRSDAASGVHVLERLEFRQLDFRQRLRVLDELLHLVAPLIVETLPVRVVVERALLELIGPACDLSGIGDRVAADGTRDH